MEIIKVLRGEKALEVIEQLLDNNYVLTPDFRLVHLAPGNILIKKSAACGPTTSDQILPLTYTLEAINKVEWPFFDKSLGEPFL